MEPGAPVTIQVLDNLEHHQLQSTTSLDQNLEPILIEIRSAVDHNIKGNSGDGCNVMIEENQVLLPTILNVTNCVISDNDKHFLVTPCVGGVVESAVSDITDSSYKPNSSVNSKEKPSLAKPTLNHTCGNISPDVDPEKIIMDLGKTTEWPDLTAASEFVVSPQLDILEIQWNEIMNKTVSASTSSNTNQPDLTINNIYSSEFVSPRSSEDDNISMTQASDRSPKEITSPTTNILVSEDIAELWGNVENNNYILEDAVGLLGNSLVLDDRFVSSGQIEDRTATQTQRMDKNQSNSPTSRGKTSTASQREDENQNSIEENACRCKSGEKKESDCCVTVCLKTLNQLRRVLENGCCKSSSLANSSLAAIALQMASSANCCSGSCV